MRFRHAPAITMLTVLAIPPALAHHGQAAYTRETVTLEATVTEFRFINPHAQLGFDVETASGEVQRWIGAMTAPNKLARAGWTKSTLKPGDEITITGRPGRNDAHAMHIMQIVMADGRPLQMREMLDGVVLP